jgi:hypothetical protein
MAGYAAGGYPIARMDDLEAPHSLRAGNARLVEAAPEMAEVLEAFTAPSQDGELLSLGELLARSQRLYAEAHTILARIRGDAP